MPAVVVRDLPPALHQRLKQEAARHHRSMNREIIAILDKELEMPARLELPPPVKGNKPADPKWIVQVIREARDGRP
jgi:hypothetical protein